MAAKGLIRSEYLGWVKRPRRRLYKLILRGSSKSTIIGFDYTPYLPQGRKPGKWLRVTGKLKTCVNGLHVTAYPRLWGNSLNCDLYLVETRGGMVVRMRSDDDKVCCREIRLVRKVEWPNS